jgi:hypothetical protein
MLKTPSKYFNFYDWDILINEAASYNILDDDNL